MNLNQTWEIVNKIMVTKFEKSEISRWVKNIKPKKIGNKVLLEVENDFIKGIIEEKYLTEIQNIYREVSLLEDLVMEVIVSSDSNESIKDNQVTIERHERKERKDNLYSPNSKYTFKNFIVGKNNEFAHAAARGVAISPGNVYNPLFIYGGVGLGKTHLMHAIGNYIKDNNPEAKIHYCSSEQFTNNLIDSLKKDKMNQFREKYRKLDVLLVDDIQFISGKDRTQEEIFHTFNSLHQYSRQIVISSDRPPKEIKNVEERLVSRFAWGLVADVKAPDFETRAAILKNKAEQEGIDISESSIRYIAEIVKTNIRELEGSLNRIVAKASLLNREIDHDLIKEVFKGFMEEKNKNISKSKILKSVSQYYDIAISEIKSDKRKKNIAKARQVSMYLLRNMMNLAFSSIGEEFGGKDHTTAMHSVNKIDGEMLVNKDLKSEIQDIKQMIVR